LLTTGLRFSPGTQVSSANKTNHHDITEILFKVALKTITLTLTSICMYWYFLFYIYMISLNSNILRSMSVSSVHSYSNPHFKMYAIVVSYSSIFSFLCSVFVIIICLFFVPLSSLPLYCLSFELRLLITPLCLQAFLLNIDCIKMWQKQWGIYNLLVLWNTELQIQNYMIYCTIIFICLYGNWYRQQSILLFTKLILVANFQRR
jgi:hypothetical protein